LKLLRVPGAVIFVIILSIVSYVIGRRSKIDDIRIKNGHEHAKKLATAFEQLHAHVSHLEQFIDINFLNFKVPRQNLWVEN
jgi:hypothetical protein